jgi:hypothetical protein
MSAVAETSAGSPVAAGASASAGGAAGGVSVKLKKWMPVGIWKFGKNLNEACPICQTPLTLRCIECQVNETRECGLSYGQCGHIFHCCCIQGWEQKNSSGVVKCPYCYTDWALVKQEHNHC